MRHVILYMGALIATTSVARADDSEACKRARAIMGDAQAARAKADDCQRRLDVAEEDDWQLWLDLALASEKSGDPEDAVAAYQRFVDAADRRGERLTDAWPRLRDEARTAIARLDTELLQKLARVTLTSVPDGAEVSLGSGGAPGTAQKTPTVRYFKPGSHTVRMRSTETGESREIRFSVEVGQTLELKVDLRAGASPERSLIEGTGPALRGQNPGRGGEGPAGDRGVAKVSVSVEGPGGKVDGKVGGTGDSVGRGGPGPDPIDGEPDDGEPPPQTHTIKSPLRTVGVAATAVGVGALAVGAVFLINGLGIKDEVEACAEPGSGCAGTAAELEELAHERDVQYDRATAAFIGGGIFVVGGIVALVLSRDETTESKPDAKSLPSGPRVTPFAGPGGAGVLTTLRF